MGAVQQRPGCRVCNADKQSGKRKVRERERGRGGGRGPSFSLRQTPFLDSGIGLSATGKMGEKKLTPSSFLNQVRLPRWKIATALETRKRKYATYELDPGCDRVEPASKDREPNRSPDAAQTEPGGNPDGRKPNKHTHTHTTHSSPLQLGTNPDGPDEYHETR